MNGRRRRAAAWALTLLAWTVPGANAAEPDRADRTENIAPIRVGSKKFTESVILAEIAVATLNARGIAAVHLPELGGTRILWRALLEGEIDTYPDYTGTLRHEILAGRSGSPQSDLRSALAAAGAGISAPLGFENGYAIGMRRERATELQIETISQLRGRADLKLSFTNEFIDRTDGWPGLARRYALSRPEVRGLDHDIAYRALAAGQLDAIDVYATDAEITGYDLVTLEDDLNFFAEYRAVFVFRRTFAGQHPQAAAAMDELSATIDEERMTGMNARAKFGGEPAEAIADDFVLKRLGIEPAGRAAGGAIARLARNTAEHLRLVAISLSAAVAVAIPLGITAARVPTLTRITLGAVGVVQTLPALALLVFMVPLFGIGAEPALAALFLYSLLPIVRNTHTGLSEIRPELIDAADAIGLSPRNRLFKIELPLAARTIFAGIKTSAVINIGTATLGALIGAGGYGQPILTGIRLDDTSLILQGAIPAALLALSAEAAFGSCERFFVAKGLRLEAAAAARTSRLEE